MNCRITDSWDDLMAMFPTEKRDIYYEERYVRLYENENDTAKCIIVEDGERIMIMPYLRRNIGAFFDFETPYGYGGPITNCDDRCWVIRAFEMMHDYFRKEKYCCGLIRFHPILDNAKTLFEYDATIGNSELVLDRQTIIMDTSESEEDIWNLQISSKNRNMIRKAEKNGLIYRREDDFESMDEFISLYKDTMSRLGADDFYFFDRQYFDDLKNSLKGKSFLATVRKDDKLICGAIFMYSKLYGHYHLQGNDRSYSSLGSGNYLIWRTACDMHNLGIAKFHLGGGTTALENDSLYKFKRAFSRNVGSFFVGKEIFNIPVYDSICTRWENENAELMERYGKYLLRYRYTKKTGSSGRRGA